MKHQGRIWDKLEEDYHMYGKVALEGKLLYEAILNLNERLSKLEKEKKEMK